MWRNTHTHLTVYYVFIFREGTLNEVTRHVEVPRLLLLARTIARAEGEASKAEMGVSK